MSVAFAPVNPRRSAHASIYGYVYQTCLGVLRWLDLVDNEVLVCEGDEDLDRLITHGVGVSEQVKALQGAVSIRDRVVTESVRQFLLTYVALRQRGDARRFVFTTTARRRHQQGDVDVLASWHDASAHPAVIAALRELLPPEKAGDVRQAVVDAFAWLDREDGWTTFLNSVEWRFEEPDLDRVRARIADRLAADSVALPVENLTNRLVAELLDASRQPEPEQRMRSRKDLKGFLATMESELAEWAATPQAARLKAVFEELDGLRYLLDAGTRDLRDGIGPHPIRDPPAAGSPARTPEVRGRTTPRRAHRPGPPADRPTTPAGRSAAGSRRPRRSGSTALNPSISGQTPP